MSTFETLRRQSRTLESLIDTKLNAYSRHTTSIASSSRREVDLESGSGTEERWSDMEEEIDGLLEKVRLLAASVVLGLTLRPVARDNGGAGCCPREFQHASVAHADACLATAPRGLAGLHTRL